MVDSLRPLIPNRRRVDDRYLGMYGKVITISSSSSSRQAGRHACGALSHNTQSKPSTGAPRSMGRAAAFPPYIPRRETETQKERRTSVMPHDDEPGVMRPSI